MSNNDDNSNSTYYLSLEEIFSLEDYDEFKMINTCFKNSSTLNLNNTNLHFYIRILFGMGKTSKEIIMKKQDCKKTYTILKIIHKEKFMKILVKNQEYYLPFEIIKKINSILDIRGFIKINLDINEYPLTNYTLKEVVQQNQDSEKVFELIKTEHNNSNKNEYIYNYNDSETKLIINKIVNNNPDNNSNNTNPIYNNTNINQNNNNNNNYQENQVNNNINNINTNNSNNQNNQNVNNYQINNNYNGNNQNNNYNAYNFSNNYTINNQNNNPGFIQNNNNFNNINAMGQNSFNNNYNANNNLPINFTQQQFNFNNINQFNCPSFSNNNFNQTQNSSLNIISNSMPPLNNNINLNMNCTNPIYNNMNFNNSFSMNINSNMINNQSCNMNLNSMPNFLPNMNLNIQTNNFINTSNNNNNKISEANGKQFEDFELLFEQKDSAKGYFPFVGLRNVGLTCYMNSTLQCLLHIPELNYYFLNRYEQKKDYLRNINKSSETKGNISEAYFFLISEIFLKQKESQNNKIKVSPEQFHNILGYFNPQFREIGANDSKDLLLYLFQSMHEELNYLGDQKLKNIPRCNQAIPQEALIFFTLVNNNLNLSIFSYLFYGIFKSETSCLTCSNKFYNFQHFQIISFPLYSYAKTKVFNIYKGFRDFIQPEIMQGDNQCYCKMCKKLTDCSVSTKIYASPPYLIINLDYGKNKKFEPQKITFSESLDLNGITEENANKLSYKLVAASSHIGRSGNSGHYIAYCKDLSDNRWYEFNDSSISGAKLEDVQKYSPYFLIYKRETKNLTEFCAEENNVCENI